MIPSREHWTRIDYRLLLGIPRRILRQPVLLWFLPGSIAFAVSLGPLSWDGAYYLFRTLHEQSPPVFHGRYAAVPLAFPTWLINRFTDDLATLRLVFSLSYAVVPLVALGLAIYTSRWSQRALFTWAAIGIGVATLPLQFFGVSEALFVAQLSWPLAFAVIATPTRTRLLFGALVASILVFMHPLAVAPLATLGVASFLRRVHNGTGGWTWPVMLFGFALLRLLLPKTAVEQTFADPGVFGLALLRAAGAAPGIALALVLIAAIGWMLASHTARNRRHVYVTFFAIAGAGLMLIAWSASANSWYQLLGYRMLVPLLTCPLLLMAFASATSTKNHRLPRQPVSLPTCNLLIAVCGIIFSSVLVIQSIAWHRSLDDFDTALANSTTRCVPESTVLPPNGPVHAFWTTTSLSIVLGDRHVSRAVLDEGKCADWVETGDLKLNPQNTPIGDGWFLH